MMKKYNFIDLFAGCGGLSEGFLQTNKFNGVAHVEWELPMVNTLRKRLTDRWNHDEEEACERVVHFDLQMTEELLNGNWSEENIKKYFFTNSEKVSKFGLDSIVKNENIDVIIGGPPCQAYSIHGRATDKNSMNDDYRNFLFESFVKIVNHYKPKLFVFENVPGILSAKPGGVYITDRIYEAFNEIGYEILRPSELKNAVFDTSNFRVPQIRKRVIIIGLPKTSDISLKEIYSKIKSKENRDDKTNVFDSIGDLPKLLPYLENKKINGKNVSHKNSESYILNHEPRYHNLRDVEIFKDWVDKKMNYSSHKDKVEYYLKKTGKNTLYSKYKNLEWKKQSHTIVAHLEKDGLMFIHPDSEQARSITVREAARLMTFPDDFRFVGNSSKNYKMIGNAVPVEFAKVLAETICEIFEKK